MLQKFNVALGGRQWEPLQHVRVTTDRPDTPRRFASKKTGRSLTRNLKLLSEKLPPRAGLKKRESELAEPNALANLKCPDDLLSVVIERYTRESKKPHGKTKKQVLSTISDSYLGSLKCSVVDSMSIVKFAH